MNCSGRHCDEHSGIDRYAGSTPWAISPEDRKQMAREDLGTTG